MIKKLIYTISAVVAAACLMTSCGKPTVVLEKGGAKPSTGDAWTVFVYMCGGTTDDDIINKTFEEMMNVDYSENINFVVETGGKSEWGIDGIDPDFNQRFLMQKNSMFLAAQTAADNMASSNVFGDFLKWGVEKFPAKHYALIVNGQGGGAHNGAAFDDISGDILTVEDAAVALGAAGVQFDIAAFDSSFMSSIETAAQLAPYAKYLVASEDMMCPYGLNYEALGSRLVSDPGADTLDICRDICDSYYEKCDKYGMADIATIAVTDLSRASELLQAFDGMAGMMSYAMDNFGNAARMQRALTYAEHAGAQSWGEGFTDMADLKNMAETIHNDMGATADLLIPLTDEVVAYNISGKARPYVKGLGVYFPISGTTRSLERYAAVSPSINYLSYAGRASINAGSSGGDDYTSTSTYYVYNEWMPQFTLYTQETPDGCLELDTSGEPLLIRDIYMDVYSHDPETGESYKVGTKYDIDGDLNGTIFTAEMPWETLGINGRAVYAKRIEKGFGFDMYSAPVLLNGKRSNIRITHKYGDGLDSYKIIGAWSGVDSGTGLDNRDFRLLKTGDKITPLFELYGGIDEKEGKPFRIGITGAEAKPAKIDGGAAYRYIAEDMYGNIHEADMCIKQEQQ